MMGCSDVVGLHAGVPGVADPNAPDPKYDSCVPRETADNADARQGGRVNMTGTRMCSCQWHCYR